MGKKRKGRPRGRGGPVGGGGGGGGGGGSQFNGRPRGRNPQRRFKDPLDRPPPDIEGADNGEPGAIEPGTGVLELHPNGYGFLRNPKTNYLRERTDPFVPGTMIEKFRLREGVLINGMVQQSRKQQGPRLKEIIDVDGIKPEDYPPGQKLRRADADQSGKSGSSWKPAPADQHARHGSADAARQGATGPDRGPAADRQDHPAARHQPGHLHRTIPTCKLIMLLIDERPEEVTDMRRSVIGEVIASSLDRDVESHVRLSQLVVERCKRLAEMGKDVFLLMDSITRLARAFNKWVGNTGRTMSGGVDIKALDIPKKLFATARVFEEGGSLTIVATALVDTGSRMDELIFQEFKGTGNMELVLDRKLADRRVWPAIDISQSGTRREEKLLEPGHAARRDHAAPHAVDDASRRRHGAVHQQAGQVQVEPRVHQADQRRPGGHRLTAAPATRVRRRVARLKACGRQDSASHGQP